MARDWEDPQRMGKISFQTWENYERKPLLFYLFSSFFVGS